MAGETRDQRVSVSFTRRTVGQLDALAEALGTTRAGLIARWVETMLRSGGLPPASAPAATDRAPQHHNGGGATVPVGGWLPPAGSDGRAVEAWWIEQRLRVQALRERYPAQLRRLPATYEHEPILREPVWALAHWRAQLDAGEHDDPRMELAFNRALRDFAELLGPAVRGTRSRPDLPHG